MKGGSRYTHANLIIGALDEVVILGHAVRHELLPLASHPAAFNVRLECLAGEAAELAERLRHHARELHAAA